MNLVTKIAIGIGIIASVTVSFAPFSEKSRFTEVNGVKWLNSYDDAVAESKRTGKPILFLSMFGKIDEDIPCANARTLRATLFKTDQFKKFSTDEVILAWEMVRKVPRVTVDLGDGENIIRTVRGNAVMYLCNSDGKAFDAFPGVYTEQDFFPAARRSISQLYRSEEPSFGGNANLLKTGQIGATRAKLAVEGPVLNLMGAKKFEGAKSTKNVDSRLQPFRLAAKRVEDMSLSPRTSEEIPALLGLPEGSMPTPDQIIANDSFNNSVSLRPIVRMYFDSLDQLPTPFEARDYILEDLLKIPYKDPYFGLKDILLPGTP